MLCAPWIGFLIGNNKMSFLVDVIGKKILNLLEDELINHEPELQAIVLAELQSLANSFSGFVEDKIAEIEKNTGG